MSSLSDNAEYEEGGFTDFVHKLGQRNHMYKQIV